MTNLRKAAEMALEALENTPIEYDFHGNPMDADFGKQLDTAVEALRQALTQPEQEAFILDRGCWERGCCAYDERDGDGVVVDAKIKEKNT